MMNNKFEKRLLSAILCLVLLAATALVFTGCQTPKAGPVPTESDLEQMEGSFEENSLSEQHFFTFEVVTPDGKTQTFHVQSTEETVGDALVKEGLIAGDINEYGLYVKTVCGTTLDFDKDKMYWAFYVDGSYATNGVDTTPIEDGKTYKMAAEK